MWTNTLTWLLSTCTGQRHCILFLSSAGCCASIGQIEAGGLGYETKLCGFAFGICIRILPGDRGTLLAAASGCASRAGLDAHRHRHSARRPAEDARWYYALRRHLSPDILRQVPCHPDAHTLRQKRRLGGLTCF